jgi:hypothetical protein
MPDSIISIFENTTHIRIIILGDGKYEMNDSVKFESKFSPLLNIMCIR